MRGIKLDVVVRQGATFRLMFRPMETLPTTTVNNDGTVTTTDGTPTNLSDLTFRSQFRVTDTKGAVQLDGTPAHFSVVTVDTKQYVLMKFTPAETGAMAPGNGVYDIEAVDSAGDVLEVIYGSYTVALEATK